MYNLYDKIMASFIRDCEKHGLSDDPRLFAVRELNSLSLTDFLFLISSYLDESCKEKSTDGDLPVAWSYELALITSTSTGEHTQWGNPKLSFTKPCVPEGSIRNLRPLHALQSVTSSSYDQMKQKSDKADMLLRSIYETLTILPPYINDGKLIRVVYELILAIKEFNTANSGFRCAAEIPNN